MSLEIIIVLTLLVIAFIFFITEWLPVDVVAMLIVAILLFTGILNVEEGFAGFGNEGTITIAAMFILSAGLSRTGVITYLGRILKKAFQFNYTIAVALTLIFAAFISAFINNTPVVAIFLPLLLQISRDTNFAPSKILLPLSYSAIFGGVCTLIGTSTNIVVNSIAVKYGQPAFSLFEITPLGLFFFVTGFIYLLFVAMRFLPERKPVTDLADSFGLGDYLTEIILTKDSNSINVRLKDAPIVKNLGLEVLEIIREDKNRFIPQANTNLYENDRLLVKTKVEVIKELKETPGILIKPGLKWADSLMGAGNILLLEAIVAPNSFLIGKSLKRIHFRHRFNSIVLALRHRGRLIRDKITDIKLLAGDSLLIEVNKDEIDKMKESDAFVLLSKVEPPSFKRSKIIISVLTITSVVLLTTLNILPIAVSAFCGSIVLVLTRCINLDQAYSAIDWKIIFLLAGSLSLGTALEKTGAAKLVSEQILFIAGNGGPLLVLSIFYLVSLILTEVMSNTATAALITPIAIVTATTMGVDPRPFLVAIMFAASLAFMSPVGYQTHLLVFNPGGYKVIDFIKAGTPLDILFWILATFLIPVFFPF
ncbi:MAG TPA: SLC13 family permease [Ignavibacteriaceae bacterium]|nr:SLC13 family permease [Ignavibacteriaceae bacterium]